jgi:hypothetical protein
MRRLILAFALVLAPLAAAAQARSYQSIGWWDVSYYPASAGCAATAEFDNGLVFLIGLDTSTGQLGLQVGLLHSDWGSIREDQEYQVEVKFGHRQPWSLTMYGARLDGLYGLENIWPAESDSAGNFVDEFMAATNMRWSYGGQLLGDLSLKDSRRAMNAAIECTQHYLGSGGGPDPFKK